MLAAGEVMVVAHRGASKDAPENTIPAFELAWERGADAIEGDFHLTKDGKVVCIHDGNTKKVAGEKLEVSKATLAQLRKLDVGVKKGVAFKGTVIPTIAEVFATIPEGKKIFVEIKCGVEILPALFDEVEKSKLQREQIVFISFNAAVIEAVKNRDSRFKANWLCSLKQTKEGVFKPSLEEAVGILKKAKADGMSSSKDRVTKDYIDGLKKAGFEHHVWTVNDVKTAHRLVEMGTQSVTTDVPGLVKKALVEKN